MKAATYVGTRINTHTEVGRIKYKKYFKHDSGEGKRGHRRRKKDDKILPYKFKQIREASLNSSVNSLSK